MYLVLLLLLGVEEKLIQQSSGIYATEYYDIKIFQVVDDLV